MMMRTVTDELDFSESNVRISNKSTAPSVFCQLYYTHTDCELLITILEVNVKLKKLFIITFLVVSFFVFELTKQS
jgi:hypothetical protein